MTNRYLEFFSLVLKNRIGIIPYPSFLTFIVTWRCNQRCIMCDIWKKGESYEMSIEEIDKIFSQLKPLDAVRITGGEPFLKEDIAEIINILNKRVKPEIIHITTNGILTERLIKFIENVKEIKNIHIKISIDAVGEEHNRIRGDKESYNKAISSLIELSKLRRKYNFYLGVNQTIVSQKCLEDHNELQKICHGYGVKLFSVLANYKFPLYKTDNNPEANSTERNINKINFFAEFNDKQITEIIEILKDSIPKLDDYIEKLVKKYYLKGLTNRLIHKKNYPNPKCVALRSHLRILPNGDVPVCIYNTIVTGNLVEEKDFKKFWFCNENVNYRRKDVSECSGCWVECEVIPNGIYTGDILRAIFG